MGEFKTASLQSSDLTTLHQMEQSLSEKLGKPIVLVAYSASDTGGEQSHLKTGHTRQNAYAQHDL